MTNGNLAPLPGGAFVCCGRALCNRLWYCFCGFAGVASGKPTLRPPSPAPRRGFFMQASPSRRATDDAAGRWEVGLPLTIWPLGGRPSSDSVDQLGAAPSGGAFCLCEVSAAQPAVVMYRRVCFPATGANPRKELSPASAGLFLLSCRLHAQCNQASAAPFWRATRSMRLPRSGGDCCHILPSRRAGRPFC